jgi:pyrroline-5-carboxylate reductase
MTLSSLSHTRVAFIGGGNMASAIIGGLLQQGLAAAQISVVEPFAETRAALHGKFGIAAAPDAGAAAAELARAALVVWAVKPQTFKDAAAAAPHTHTALHLSVAAGITSDSLAQWLGSDCIVRAMPNTPALIGRGMTALYARAGVSGAQRDMAQAVAASTGDVLWVDAEAQLDAVTALSGSGPAYVFYFLEAMVRAGSAMGLPPAQAQRLAVATFAGAAELARQSSEPLELLRQRVTSKGGTTHAAIESMQADGVGAHFEHAMQAACARAAELGREFGA